MPLAKPEPQEAEEEFIDRCMKDKIMILEFPDPAQRRGVCQSQWDTNKPTNKSKKETIL